MPDQIAYAWAAVLIDIYQRLKQREDAKAKQDGEATRNLVIGHWDLVIGHFGAAGFQLCLIQPAESAITRARSPVRFCAKGLPALTPFPIIRISCLPAGAFSVRDKAGLFLPIDQ